MLSPHWKLGTSVPRGGHLYNLFTDFSWKNENKGQFKSASYLRINVLDTPGILGRISTLLGAHRINISSVVQRIEDKKSMDIPLTMLLNPTTDENMNCALKELERLDCVRDTLRIIIQN